MLGAVVWGAGRSLTGDAPALLGRARRLGAALASGDVGGALGALLGQVVPQPPGGYAMAMAPYLLGLEAAAPVATSLLALAMVAGGLSLAAGREGERSPLGVAPLGAWLLLLATPMTWVAAEHVQWDLLCAGWVALALGALARSDDLRRPRWAVAAGLLAGLSALVKYNGPFFLWLPLLVAALVAGRGGRWRDAGRLVLAGAAPLLLWAPLAMGELLPYLSSSASGSLGVDSASAVPSAAERLGLVQLAYYPAVLKDALGWPGLALCLAAPLAWRRPSGRVLCLAVLGGALSLSLVGRREPRYLLPLLPPLLLAAELGWGQLRPRAARLAAGAALLLLGGAQLWGTARTYADWPDPRPLTELSFGPDNLLRFGTWPWPERAFVPTSAEAGPWQLAEAVAAVNDALPDDTQGGGGEAVTVGLLMYAHPRVPSPGLFTLEAGRQGRVWDVVELEILSASQEGPPPPEVQVGRMPGGGGPRPKDPPPPPKRPEDETFILRAVPGPVPSLVASPPTFDLLYSVHPRQEPFYDAFFQQLGALKIDRFDLPNGFTGTLWRLSDPVWASPLGQQLRESLDAPGAPTRPRK